MTRRTTACALLLTLALACGGSGPEPPRLVVLYAPCTVNKSHLAPYNPLVAYTPNLESFARDARVFARHQTEAPQSGIAYASILTGSQADTHGVFRHPVTLSDDRYVIFEAFADQGYETFFWNNHLAAGPNYGQGVAPERWIRKTLSAADPRFIEVLDRLVEDPDYRALIVANFSVTHSAYSMQTAEHFRTHFPAEAGSLTKREVARCGRLYRKNFHQLSWKFDETVDRLGLGPDQVGKLIEVASLLYESRVAELDRMFGELVEKIDFRGLRDESLVVFTADHGEMLYRANAPFQFSHSMQLAPEVLGVPLLIRTNDPRIGAGMVSGVTRSIDVFPTIAGLAGVELSADAEVRGFDLAPALRGEAPFPELLAFSHTTVLVRSVFEQMYEGPHTDDWTRVRELFPDDSPEHMWVAVRDGDVVYKIRKPLGGDMEPVVFDWKADPGEARNLYDPDDASQKARFAALSDYKARLVTRYYESEDAARLLPRDRELETLKELGYVQ